MKLLQASREMQRSDLGRKHSPQATSATSNSTLELPDWEADSHISAHDQSDQSDAKLAASCGNQQE